MALRKCPLIVGNSCCGEVSELMRSPALGSPASRLLRCAVSQHYIRLNTVTRDSGESCHFVPHTQVSAQPPCVTDMVHLRGDPKAASPSRKPPALVWGVRAPTRDCRALRAKKPRENPLMPQHMLLWSEAWVSQEGGFVENPWGLLTCRKPLQGTAPCKIIASILQVLAFRCHVIADQQYILFWQRSEVDAGQ